MWCVVTYSTVTLGALDPNLQWKREELMVRVNEKEGRKGGMNDGGKAGKRAEGRKSVTRLFLVVLVVTAVEKTSKCLL